MISAQGFSGSYDPADVTFLLTPIAMPTISLAEKEQLLRSGTVHYSHILSTELPPSDAYLTAYKVALKANAPRLASDIAALATAIARRPIVAEQGRRVVLASLARAGTPIGVLIARKLRRLGVTAQHYSISIIRDRGIDRAAIEFIRNRHPGVEILFVDGWTGKGAIAAELRNSQCLADLGIPPYLVVVADPAGQADLAATADDYVIPSGLLNGIVSGLVSRSVLTDEIGPGAFHGCRILSELTPYDQSREFLATIEQKMVTDFAYDPTNWNDVIRQARRAACCRLLENIGKNFLVANRNSIKPGVAEATRAVLRRVPRMLLLTDIADPQLSHLVMLANERNVPIVQVDELFGYRAVALLP